MKSIAAAIFVAAVIISVVFHSRLPETAPIHWNSAGEADNFAPRIVAVSIGPALLLGMALLFLALPAISPRGWSIDRTSRGYRATTLVTLLALLAFHAIAVLSAAGVPIDMNVVMPIVLGALFVVMGNYMTTVQRNFFIGIRTPWTLASEDVWFRTHRLGGRLFMAGGIAIALMPLFGIHDGFVPLLLILGVVATIPIVYSYVIYRRST